MGITGWSFSAVSWTLPLISGLLSFCMVTGEEQEEWDRLNALAFAKLKFKYYVPPGVHAVMWKGQRLTAFQNFERLQTLLLNGGMHSRTALEAA